MTESRPRIIRPVEDIFSPLLVGPVIVTWRANEDQTPLSDEDRAKQDALKQDPHHDLPDSIVLGSD